MRAALLLCLLVSCVHGGNHGRAVGPSQVECSAPLPVVQHYVELDPQENAEHEFFTRFRGPKRVYFAIWPSTLCPIRRAVFRFGTLKVLVGQPPWQVVIDGDDAAAWAEHWYVSLDDSCGRTISRGHSVTHGPPTPDISPVVTCVTVGTGALKN